MISLSHDFIKIEIDYTFDQIQLNFTCVSMCGTVRNLLVSLLRVCVLQVSCGISCGYSTHGYSTCAFYMRPSIRQSPQYMSGYYAYLVSS